jgi:archaellum component FlaC
MRVRHRIPSIFNLSMVDVLCCALGCVILLWLINLREAKQHEDNTAEQSRQTAALLESARADRDSAYTMLVTQESLLAGSEEERAELGKQLAAQKATTADLELRLKGAGKRIASLEEELRDSARRYETATARAADLERQLKTAQAGAAALDEKLKDARAGAAVLEEKVKDARVEAADLEGKLKEARAEAGKLTARLEVSRARTTDLEDDLRANEKKRDAQAARARELVRELEAANARIKDLQAMADLVPGLRAELKTAQGELAKEEALARALEKEVTKRIAQMSESDKTMQGLQRDLEGRDKELASARLYKDKWAEAERRLQGLEGRLGERQRDLARAVDSIAALQGEKRALQTEVSRVRTAADNRFAGIALTGRRVVFLVDMSGSMKLVDPDTAAPNKWAEVAGTVARLMRSMPDLEKFQVILFAEQTAFLFKDEGAWIDYDPKTSGERVVKALQAREPDGGTNMYGALEAAFRLRDRGLDTIYLLSDGLPNLGEGLNAAQAGNLKEVERNDILARYIRRKLKTDWNREAPGRPRVRINTIGFFFESPDVGAFLWALARENDGSFVGMSKP